MGIHFSWPLSANRLSSRCTARAPITLRPSIHQTSLYIELDELLMISSHQQLIMQYENHSECYWTRGGGWNSNQKLETNDRIAPLHCLNCEWIVNSNTQQIMWKCNGSFRLPFSIIVQFEGSPTVWSGAELSGCPDKGKKGLYDCKGESLILFLLSLTT